jgi:hypothetical protein
MAAAAMQYERADPGGGSGRGRERTGGGSGPEAGADSAVTEFLGSAWAPECPATDPPTRS